MSADDKRKWEKKYIDKPELLDPRPPSSTLVAYCCQAVGGQALDVACGSGRNALYLAQQGFNVDAVDISETAINTLQRRANGLSVHTYCDDLDTFEPPRRYDLIVMTNYLDRTLLARLRHYLQHGGLFIVESYMHHPDNEKANTSNANLLRPGELKELFEGMQVLYYDEFWNESYEIYRMRKQAVVAQQK